MHKLTSDWQRDRVVWVSDYSNKPEYYFPRIDFVEHEKFNYSLNGYIYNIDKKERIDMSLYNKLRYRDSSGYIMHPLPVLLADDYIGDYDNKYDPMIGAWAGDRIFVSRYSLRRYEDVTIKVYPIENCEWHNLPECDYEKAYKRRIQQFSIKKIVYDF